MGKHHGKHGKSGLGKVLGIAGFAAGFAFPGAFLGAAAGTTGAVRLSAALMGLSLGTTIGSAFAKQSQDMPASNFDNKMNVVDQNAMIPVVYGTRKIGGLQSYHNTSIKNKSLTKDIILGEGQFSGCYGVTANGYTVGSNTSGAVFGIVNTKYPNAYVRVSDGKLEFDTNGVVIGHNRPLWGPFIKWYQKYLDTLAQGNSGYRKIDLQSADDMADDESNDFQCSMAKLYQYIEGIRYDNDLATLGWKVVNPVVVDDAPKHLNNTSWVNVGNGQTAWFSMNHEETKDSWVTFHDGTQNPPSYYMKTGAYPNMAYIHAYLKYTDQLGSGNPTITCVAKGRKVYDTRTKKWDYSENPAMIIRDYLINTTFGSGRYINESMIDEDSFKDAANYCDEMVTSFDTQGRTITEPRYRLNIVINSKRSYLENLQSMLACCAGYLVFTKGQVAMRIERADNPVYVFDDDNIIQGSMSYTAASSTESPNKLNMKYIEPTLDWTSVSAIVEDLADQKQQPIGRGKIVEKDVELIGVTSQCQALRLGKIYRDLIRLCPISIEFKTAMQALNLEPGDVVTISHNVVLEDNKVQPLFKDMPVRITEIRDDSGTYTIKAQQYNASIYDDRMGGSIKDFDYTTVKKPEDLLPKAVPNVENLNAYTIYKQGRDGVANYDLVVTYDLPSGYLLETGMVYYKCNEGYDLSTLGVIPEGVTGAEVGFANDWKFAGEGPSRLVIPNVHIGVTYKLLVQARNKSGDKAPMIDCPVFTITVERKTTVPNKPDGLSIKYTDVATVSWEDVTNSDIDYYEVRTNKDTGKDEGLLARTSDTSVVVPLSSRTGTIYVFGHNTSKLYGYPAVLEYNKALPPKPHAPTVVSKLGALGITTDAIPADCTGVKIHINHDTITSTNNTVQYPCDAGVYNVSYGFYDLFGEGPVSDETATIVKVLVDQKLLEDGAVSLKKVDETVQDAINKGIEAKNSVVQLVGNLNKADGAKNYSALVQLQDDINLRVVKGDVISQINLDKTGATIDGKLVHITGDTVIEKNVIAKGMIQAGAVTTDNLAAETINLQDKLAIQGGAVTLDENGMTVKETSGSSVQFGQDGMSFIDSNGHTFAGIGRFCTGIANDGQTVKFANPWDVVPAVFLFPVRLQTSAVGYTNINMYQDVEAINVSKEGFTAVCRSVLKAGSGADIPVNNTFANVSVDAAGADGLPFNPDKQSFTYNINIPDTATHIWVTLSFYCKGYTWKHHGSTGNHTVKTEAYSDLLVYADEKLIESQTKVCYADGNEKSIHITRDYNLSKISTVKLVVNTTVVGQWRNRGTCTATLVSYRTNLDSDVVVCQGTAGFIAIDPNKVSYTVS